MTDEYPAPALSRRGLLLGGAAVLGASGAGAALFVAGRRTGREVAQPQAVRTVAAVPSAAPVALGTALLPTLGLPVPLLDLAPLPDPAVMQDVSAVPVTGIFFVTQKTIGSNGTASPYESTIVNRVRASDGMTLDSMTLVDGGHGLGFEAEADGDGAWIWMTWHGKSADSGWREQDFVRFRYAPGTWARGVVNQQLGLTVLPFQDRTPEAVYHFDWAKDSAVERHFNWPDDVQAPTETFVRRRISDLRAGVDRRLAEIRLRASPPTTQGFATVNETFFRWLGTTAVGGAPNASDPIVLEQYSWATGQLVATAAYPAIGAPWNDGMCEPQGLCVLREADGTASLVLGNTTGAAGHHTYRLSKLGGVGTA